MSHCINFTSKTQTFLIHARKKENKRYWNILILTKLRNVNRAKIRFENRNPDEFFNSKKFKENHSRKLKC